MASEEGRSRRWLRAAGLFALVLALAVGQPLLLVVVPFGLLGFLVPTAHRKGLIIGAVLLGLAFVGAGSSGGWYLDRGWAILIGGWFAAVTLAAPNRPFIDRGLVAVGGSAIWATGVILLLDGWDRLERVVRMRVEESAAATFELSTRIGGGGEESTMAEAVQRTAELQATVFPALLALASLAGLGAAWWLHQRLGEGSDRGLGSLAGFRFTDGLVWLLIGGLALVLTFGWAEGWGRLGTNVALFTGALYALRGAGILLFMSGGVGWAGGIVTALALVFAAPVVLAGAMVVGLSDTWFDLRARVARARTDDGRDDS